LVTINQRDDSPDTSTSLANDADRGRGAARPTDIPPKGWLDVGWRTIKRFSDDNVTLIAGGLAMYALLSVFPALAATVSLYGMFSTPGNVINQMSAFAGVLPPGVWDIFNTELQAISKTGQGTLTLAASLGIVVALWSARAAMSSLMTATNIAYREHETRGFIRTTLLSLAFTAGAIVAFLLMLTLGVAIPLALAAFGAADWTKAAVGVLRIALLWSVIVSGLAVVYRYAPARKHARWRWVTAGSLIAATLLLSASALFAFYVTNFAGYAKTYGALGGVVVLLMWFFISSMIVIVGAQINAELERQTAKDSTVSRHTPLGQRGAFAANTIGPPVESGQSPGESGPKDASARSNRSSRPKHHGTGRMYASGGGASYSRRTSKSFVSDAGRLLDKVATLSDPRRRTASRVTATVAAVRISAQVVPPVVRILRRHPMASTFAVAMTIMALKAIRSHNRGALNR
jgi:membrane protein